MKLTEHLISYAEYILRRSLGSHGLMRNKRPLRTLSPTKFNRCNVLEVPGEQVQWPRVCTNNAGRSKVVVTRAVKGDGVDGFQVNSIRTVNVQTNST